MELPPYPGWPPVTPTDVHADTAAPKDYIAAFILCLLLGFWGAHLFYLGRLKQAVLRLTAAIVGVVGYWYMTLFAFQELSRQLSGTTNDATRIGLTPFILGTFCLVIYMAVIIWQLVDIVQFLTLRMKDSQGQPLEGQTRYQSIAIILFGGYIILMMLLFAASSFIRTQATLARQRLALQNQVAIDRSDQLAVNKLLHKVGTLYPNLPKDEQPTLSTVRNKTQLSDQPFFANAQNGDIVFFYPQHHFALLYRPSTNQIINTTTNATPQDGQVFTPASEPYQPMQIHVDERSNQYFFPSTNPNAQ